MAIAGLLIHVLPDAAKKVEQNLAQIQGISTYGIHKESYIVAVGEAKSNELEQMLATLEKLEDVLAVYLSSLSTEDEYCE